MHACASHWETPWRGLLQNTMFLLSNMSISSIFPWEQVLSYLAIFNFECHLIGRLDNAEASWNQEAWSPTAAGNSSENWPWVSSSVLQWNQRPHSVEPYSHLNFISKMRTASRRGLFRLIYVISDHGQNYPCMMKIWLLSLLKTVNATTRLKAGEYLELRTALGA